MDLMDIREIEAILEGLLFAWGDVLPADKISEIIGVDKKTIKLIMNNMAQSLQTQKRGVMIREISNGYIMCTKPEYHRYLEKLFERRQQPGLTQAGYETLGIIAYNSPATRARIEQVRGVNSDSSINTLLERNLIREAGRLEAPGRPLTYEVTEEFLKAFGFRSLKELPDIKTNDPMQILQNEPD